jgi:UDP:flavonoid glycosyltransferase YjiC (YdhE family)
LSVGPKLYKDFKSTYKENVSIYSWVSQAQALDMADICFTHGGLATVKEAIFYGVPIVIVPQGKDQMDNALRVKRNKVGVISQADKLSAESLKLAMTRVATSPWILDNVTKMQTVFENEETAVPRPSVELVEGVINGTLPS